MGEVPHKVRFTRLLRTHSKIHPIHAKRFDALRTGLPNRSASLRQAQPEWLWVKHIAIRFKSPAPD